MVAEMEWPEWPTNDLIEHVNAGTLMDDSACPTCLCPASFHQKTIEQSPAGGGWAAKRARLFCPRDVFDPSTGTVDPAKATAYWERLSVAARGVPNSYVLQAAALRRLDNADTKSRALLSIANTDRRREFARLVDERAAEQERRAQQMQWTVDQAQKAYERKLEQAEFEAADKIREQRDRALAAKLGTSPIDEEPQWQPFAPALPSNATKMVNALKGLYGEQIARMIQDGRSLEELQQAAQAAAEYQAKRGTPYRQPPPPPAPCVGTRRRRYATDNDD